MNKFLNKKLTSLECKSKIKKIDITHKLSIINLLIPNNYDKNILPPGFSLSADIKFSEEEQQQYLERFENFYSFNEDYDKLLYKELITRRKIKLNDSIKNLKKDINIGMTSGKAKEIVEILTINKDILIEVLQNNNYKYNLKYHKDYEITIYSDLEEDKEIYQLLYKRL